MNKLFACKSGRHHWLLSQDAAKCCDPDWMRILRVAGPGDDLRGCATIQAPSVDCPAWTGRQWVKKSNKIGSEDNGFRHELA